MEITILKHIGDIKCDTEEFLSIYKESFSIANALACGEVSGNYDKEKLMTLACDWFDWAKLIGQAQANIVKDIQLSFYVCQYKDKIEYYEGKINKKTKQFKLTQTKRNGKAIIIFNNIITHPNYAIQTFINNNTFIYGNNEWNIK